MLTKRVNLFFLLKDDRLVKGTNFLNFTDVGDPMSQAMVYDAQGAEEISIVDIEATSQKRLMDMKIIRKILAKSRLPIAIGGGIKSLKDAGKYFAAGADKIILNTHAFLNPALVKELSDEFGSQSVVVSVDVKKNSGGKYDIFVYSGKQKIDLDFETMLKKFGDDGAGELIVTSIDREGTLSGFDLELYETAKRLAPMPLIASGGAGCYDHIVDLFQKIDCDGCAIGKMLFLRDYDVVRIKSYLKNNNVFVRDS